MSYGHMPLRIIAAIIALVFFVSGVAAEEQIQPGQQGKLLNLEHDRAETPTVLYVPSDYEPSRKWPLIICMHGLRGSPTTGPWKEMLGGKGYLIAGVNYADVELKPTGEWKGAYDESHAKDRIIRDYLRGVIERVASLYRIDRGAIFYVGNSMGGWNIGNFCCTPDSAEIYRGYVAWGCLTRMVNECNFSLVKGKPVMIYHGQTCFVLKGQPVEKDLKNLTKAGMNLTRIIYQGQGHGIDTGVCRPDVVKWFEEVRQEDRMLKGYCPLAWSAATFAGAPADKTPEALAVWLKEQDFFKDRPEGKPLLLWLYADASSTVKGKTAPTKETRKSDKGFTDLFEYPAAVETPEAAQYFACYAISLNGISKKDNAVFNADLAPQIVLLSRDGETVLPLAGSLSDKALAAKMLTLLNEEEKAALTKRIADFAAVRKQWKDLAKGYLKNQDKLLKMFPALLYDDKRILDLKEEQTKILQQFQSLHADFAAEK